MKKLLLLVVVLISTSCVHKTKTVYDKKNFDNFDVVTQTIFSEDANEGLKTFNTMYVTFKDTGYYYIEAWEVQYRYPDKMYLEKNIHVSDIPHTDTLSLSDYTYRVEIYFPKNKKMSKEVITLNKKY